MHTSRIALPYAEIAQLVEHAAENRGVASSILALGIQNPFYGVFSFRVQSAVMINKSTLVKILCTVCAALLLLSACANPKVWIWVVGEPKPQLVSAQSATPQQILSSVGIQLSEGDRVLLDGIILDPEQPISLEDGALLHVRKGVEIQLDKNGVLSTFKTSAITLGVALWEQSIIISASDYISLPLETALDQPLQVIIRKSQPITILVDNQQILAPSASQTVGEALASAGVSLQDLDYSIPAEQESIPAEGIIRVVRVQEELILEQKTVPFENETIADDELDLDQTHVLSAGEFGVQIARIHVRFEDGEEVSRETEEQWLAKAPKAQQIAYGTKITIRSLDTPSGPIEYWRAISVYITSYHETGSRTSSGTWPVKGDIAVKLDWYRNMKGQRLYVPDYGIGVISDVCPGCVGKPWIDVFLSKESGEYVGWHYTKTVYFLTPVPATIPYILP